MLLKRIFISLFLLSLSLQADDYKTPVILPHVDREMTMAGFWISQHPSPDAVIMDPQAISVFNLANHQKSTKNIFRLFTSFNPTSFAASEQQTLQSIINQQLITIDGIQADSSLFDEIRQTMNLDHAGSIMKPTCGMVVHYTNERVLPTNEGLYDPGDGLYTYKLGLFDLLQNSALDVGTPVVVLHISNDQQWYYVVTEICDGWVAAADVALGTEEQVRIFSDMNSPVVAVQPHADLFLNSEKTDYYDSIRMGMTLPLVSSAGDNVTVKMPTASADGSLKIIEATMNTDEVHIGYLPYTARNIYEAAFAMLNQPYGWGDSFGQQDCSRFLDMVFGTVGIKLPRNSTDEANAGTRVGTFVAGSSDVDRLQLFSHFPAGTTFLHLPGHIMLYLGTINGTPYAIHDTTRFYSEDAGDPTINFLNCVIVSDLSLQSALGTHPSYLQRLTDADAVK
ncbi:MAG: hypothetical protein FJ390_00285 [Verrucomicrobia bacterium]|nr:hypothetical protein [Verrucomicrobiota bacterium]